MINANPMLMTSAGIIVTSTSSVSLGIMAASGVGTSSHNIILLGSYSTAYRDSWTQMQSGLYPPEEGQTFSLSMARYITSVQFYLSKQLSPSGNITMNIYSTTGTVGVNATPTGSVRGSATFPASSVAAYPSWTLATFTLGTPCYVPAGGCAVTLYYQGPAMIMQGIDVSSPTASGNWCNKAFDNTWTGQNNVASCFSAYGY